MFSFSNESDFIESDNTSKTLNESGKSTIKKIFNNFFTLMLSKSFYHAENYKPAGFNATKNAEEIIKLLKKQYGYSKETLKNIQETEEKDMQKGLLNLAKLGNNMTRPKFFNKNRLDILREINSGEYNDVLGLYFIFEDQIYPFRVQLNKLTKEKRELLREEIGKSIISHMAQFIIEYQ